MKDFMVESDIEIKPYNIDAAGHVNNAVYINWLEDLRMELFNKYFGLQELLKKDLYPVITSTEILYKHTLHLFDKPTGKMYLDSIKHGLMILKAEIKLEEITVAICKQKCVLLNLTTSKIVKDHQLNEITNHLVKS